MHQPAALAGGDLRRDLGGAEHRRGRHVAAGQRLADAHHVRDHARVFAGEQLAGTPEPRRDLVEDEQQPVLVGTLAQQRSESGA